MIVCSVILLLTLLLQLGDLWKIVLLSIWAVERECFLVSDLRASQSSRGCDISWGLYIVCYRDRRGIWRFTVLPLYHTPCWVWYIYLGDLFYHHDILLHVARTMFGVILGFLFDYRYWPKRFGRHGYLVSLTIAFRIAFRPLHAIIVAPFEMLNFRLISSTMDNKWYITASSLLYVSWSLAYPGDV